jgi:hypothetical protein
MKYAFTMMILVYAGLMFMMVSKETKPIQVPLEHTKYEYLEPKDLFNDTTMSYNKRITLDRIYEQGE